MSCSIEACSRNCCCCCGEAISILCSECVFVALGIQRVTRMRHIVYLWAAPLYNIFSTLSHKRQDFGKKVIEYKNMCFNFLYILSETFLLRIRNVSDNICREN